MAGRSLRGASGIASSYPKPAVVKARTRRTRPTAPRIVFNQTVEDKEGRAVAADALSRVFAALADPTRRDMVARLAAGDATVNELAKPYDVTVQAVSKHLKVLGDAGLVSRGRNGQRRPVHL